MMENVEINDNTLLCQDVHYTVKTPENELHILKGVSCSFGSGKVHAIMGSSGSGKSTLLDCIASRKTAGTMSGSVRWNGNERVNFKKLCGYVQQHDSLLSTMTVFEALMFNVQLRTPYGVNTYSEHVSITEALINDLGLSHRRDARIGSPEQKSLSGGEMRRVSIGQELCSQCPCLLLDEPTSGLDSTNANQVLQLLHDIAHTKQKVVVLTIHQPSSKMLDLFDFLMVLNLGKTVYYGTKDELVPHLETNGFFVPTFTNPCDFLLDLAIDDPSAAPVLQANAYATQTGTLLNSVIAAQASRSSNSDDENSMTGSDVEFKRVPFWFELRLLYARAFKQWIRNPLMLVSELIQYLFCGIFIGLMYHKFGTDLTSGTFDRLSAVFFVLTCLCFVPSFTIITLQNEEMPLFKREISGGVYGVTANFLAKMGTTWPFELFLTLLFTACVYWLAGFVNDAGTMLTFYFILAIFVLLSESIGLVCALLTPNSTIGVLLLSIILLVCLALGGFLVSTPKVYYEWFENINFFTFAQTACFINQFDGLTLYEEGTGIPVDGLHFLKQTGRIRNDLTLWQNIGILIAILLLTRLICLGLMYRKFNKSTFKKSKSAPSSPETQKPVLVSPASQV